MSHPERDREMTITLSHYQARPMLEAHERGQSAVKSSLNLGLTEAELELGAEGVRLPQGGLLGWEALKEVIKHDSSCFMLEGGQLRKIQAFSERLGRPYTLYPTPGAPALLVAGIPMHRIKDIEPQEDAAAKVKAAGGMRGRVLDTATGLGYTAIELSRTAHTVVTVEWDPLIIDLARLNPWSQDLFQRHNLQRVIGDAYALVEGAPDRWFDAILHDPPSVDLAGDLYAAELYRHFLRVLRPGGRLFHYVGNPDAPAVSRTWDGVRLRLEEAGFASVQERRSAFGLLTHRPR